VKQYYVQLYQKIAQTANSKNVFIRNKKLLSFRHFILKIILNFSTKYGIIYNMVHFQTFVIQNRQMRLWCNLTILQAIPQAIPQKNNYANLQFYLVRIAAPNKELLFEKEKCK
jgi:hypothetical protein